MPKKKNDHYHRYLDDPADIQAETDEPSDEEDFTTEELENLYELLGDFPELDEINDILGYDDEDFYTEHH